ncbi:hypothetical protein [Polaribacter uvawellassae]|uniref:hypothetical protein n=1 Tax=Polaribacter uvawellassae TaxID=3133495 RepID=UPI003218F64D
MRIGTNPEKDKKIKINYKQHRVIIPVYIPDSNEKYFKNLFDVFKVSINSLIKTTNSKQTNITIINNNCNKDVTTYIDNLLEEKKIDKHLKMASNYGKLYTILSEAKASYEELITIADADVYYFNNWFKESVDIFNTFAKVGLVAPLPMPELAYYSNNSLFTKELFNIKKSKIVSDIDFKLFKKSLGFKEVDIDSIVFKDQLFLKKNDVVAVVGGGHFVATYRKTVLDNLENKKPIYVFKNRDEKDFLDEPIDKLGYYRVSTVKTFAYHLGNSIPDWIQDNNNIQEKNRIHFKQYQLKKTFIPYFLKKVITKLYKKLRK